MAARPASWRLQGKHCGDGSEGACRPFPRADRQGLPVRGGGARAAGQPQGLCRRLKRRPAGACGPAADPVDRLIVEVAPADPTAGARMVAALASRQLGRQVNRKRAQRVLRRRSRSTPSRERSRSRCSRRRSGRHARPAPRGRPRAPPSVPPSDPRCRRRSRRRRTRPRHSRRPVACGGAIRHSPGGCGRGLRRRRNAVTPPVRDGRDSGRSRSHEPGKPPPRGTVGITQAAA